MAKLAPDKFFLRARHWLAEFLRERMREFFATVFVFLGILWAIALVSASPYDISLNQAGSTSPANWLGLTGAYVADISFQLLGASAWALLPGWFGWGIRRMLARPMTQPNRRAAACILSVPLLALAFALWPHNPASSTRLAQSQAQAGGVVGQMLARPLAQRLVQTDASAVAQALPRPLSPPRAAQTLSLLLGALGGLLALYSGGLLRLSWRLARAGTLLASSATWWLVKQLFGWQERGSADSSADTSTDAPAPPAAPHEPPAKPARRASSLIARLKPKAAPRRKSEPAEAAGASPDGKEFLPPPLSLLKRTADAPTAVSDADLAQQAKQLEAVLREFSIEGRILKVRTGPVITLYEFEPAAGVRTSRIVGLADDIARSMKAMACRVAVVPGQNVIGIELPHAARAAVSLRALLGAREFTDGSSTLPLALGKEITGAPFITDLLDMPHLLVAGTTGAGKSVGINAMIMSLLYRRTPEECRLILIDPKILELSAYEGIPHLLAPVVTDSKKAIFALKWAVREMEQRYQQMSALGVRNIKEFNARIAQARARNRPPLPAQTGGEDAAAEPQEFAPLPFVVIVIDEMADLMAVAGKEIEQAVQRLAQMARAAGLHLITATQRPSVDVITGTIKANFPSRIAFQVASKIDSRTILGEQGAEQLLGQGDMLVMSGGGRIQRVHGAFVSDEEVKRVVQFLKKQGAPDYLLADAITRAPPEPGEQAAGETEDPLYAKALEAVMAEQRPSISLVQRRLQIGYNRAARLIEEMERKGIISAPNNAGKREILTKP